MWFRFFIASIWFINGFFCKLLNIVPRHREIVGNILGNEYAILFTKLIGIAEIVMAIWILSKYRSRLNATLQIFIIATMNILEFILVPDLLLWGRFNALFALLFIIVIYFYEFKLVIPQK